MAVYCGQECQRSDWKRHALICGNGEEEMIVKESHVRDVLPKLLDFVSLNDLKNLSERSRSMMKATRQVLLAQKVIRLESERDLQMSTSMSQWIRRLYVSRRFDLLMLYPQKSLITHLEMAGLVPNFTWVREFTNLVYFKLDCIGYNLPEGPTFFQDLPPTLENLFVNVVRPSLFGAVIRLHHLVNLRFLHLSEDNRRKTEMELLGVSPLLHTIELGIRVTRYDSDVRHLKSIEMFEVECPFDLSKTSCTSLNLNGLTAYNAVKDSIPDTVTHLSLNEIVATGFELSDFPYGLVQLTVQRVQFETYTAFPLPLIPATVTKLEIAAGNYKFSRLQPKLMYLTHLTLLACSINSDLTKRFALETCEEFIFKPYLDFTGLDKIMSSLNMLTLKVFEVDHRFVEPTVLLMPGFKRLETLKIKSPDNLSVKFKHWKAPDTLQYFDVASVMLYGEIDYLPPTMDHLSISGSGNLTVTKSLPTLNNGNPPLIRMTKQ